MPCYAIPSHVHPVPTPCPPRAHSIPVAPTPSPSHPQGTDDDGSPLANMAHQEAWETTMRIIAVTQFSQHFCCKAGARHILKGGRGGSIVLIGSIMAVRPPFARGGGGGVEAGCGVVPLFRHRSCDTHGCCDSCSLWQVLSPQGTLRRMVTHVYT